MSNEEKILSLLTKMQSDIDTLCAEFKAINGNSKPKEKEITSQEQYEAFMGLTKLLDNDEKEALGKYMAAEEARKAALYG